MKQTLLAAAATSLVLLSGVARAENTTIEKRIRRPLGRGRHERGTFERLSRRNDAKYRRIRVVMCRRFLRWSVLKHMGESICVLSQSLRS